MAITKLPRSGIADDAINADKIEDGTIQAVEITGTVSASKLNDTLDISGKTVTLPNTSVTSDMLANTTIANAKLSNSSVTIRGTSRSLGDSFSLNVDVDWQSVITSDTTMVAGRGYFVNTTSGAVTMTLPSSAAIGDTIAIKDYAGTFNTNNLTIARNGHKIQGNSNSSTITTNRASLVLVYVDTTKGWLYTDEHNVADLQGSYFTEATGGTIATSGNFKIHSFTGDGCFVVSQIGISGPTGGGPSNVDYLVVAGGGGGGGVPTTTYAGGGGGAGGYRTTFPSPNCNAGSFPVSATTYPITVGGGGAVNVKGSNSVFSTITSAGGGGGGTASPSPNGIGCGSNGGSGGGGAGHNVSPVAGGSGNTPPVSPSQGNNGGNGAGVPPDPVGFVAGGGGGASAVGANAASGNAGDGGNGSPVTSTFGCAPQPFYAACGIYAGGGGGGRGPGGNGGTGGGGQGEATGPTAPPTAPGTANTGGGGGGVNNANPAAGIGGKGVVLIRYKFQ